MDPHTVRSREYHVHDPERHPCSPNLGDPPRNLDPGDTPMVILKPKTRNPDLDPSPSPSPDTTRKPCPERHVQIPMEQERSSASGEMREAISADASYGSGPRPETRGAPTAALRSGLDVAAAGDAATQPLADGAARCGSSADGERASVSADASYGDGDEPRADGRLGGRSTAGLRGELDAAGFAPQAPVDPTRQEQSAADGGEALGANASYARGQQPDQFGSTAELRGELDAAGVRPEAPQDLARRGDRASRDGTGPTDASYADGAAEGGFGGVSTAELRGAFDAAGRPLEPPCGAGEQGSRSPAAQAEQTGGDAASASNGGTAEAAAGGLSPAVAQEALEAAGAVQPLAPGLTAGAPDAAGGIATDGGPQPFASADLGSWPLQGDVGGHRLQGGDVGNHQLGGEVGSHQLQGSVGSHQLNNHAGNGVPGPAVVDQTNPAKQQLQHLEQHGMQPNQPSDAQRAGADPQPSQPASAGQHSGGDGAFPDAPGPAAHPSQAASPSTALEAGRSDQAPLGLARTVSLSEGMAGARHVLHVW